MLQPWSHVFATPGRRLRCFIFFCIVRFWADPPLLTFALEAGLFAFIERGAQFELFALYRQRTAASPSLCFNHTQGRFRGHSPNGGLVCCTWIFISNYLQGRGRSAKRPTIIPLEVDLDVRLHRTALGCTLLQLPHRRTWADPPLVAYADQAGEYALNERGAQDEEYASYRKRRAALWCTVRSLPNPQLETST